MSRRLHARDLTIAFCLYALLAAAASWPLVRDFSTLLLGEVDYDQRHSLWLLWHVKEALLGRQPFFTADLVFYPHGISTLVDGVGAMSGILALPFWPWGPVAAYNGATLLGLTLSGWCMYLLVRYGATSADLPASAVPRSLSTDDAGSPSVALRVAAFFAGVVFMLFPIHLAGLYGHIEKVFVGLLPLNVLAGLLAYDPVRSRWWWCAPGVTLLLVLLHNGNQFVFALLALVFLGVLCSVRRGTDASVSDASVSDTSAFDTSAGHASAGHASAGHTGASNTSAPGITARGTTVPSSRRLAIVWPVVRRVLAAGAIAIVIAGPMLVKVGRVARDPTLDTVYAVGSLRYAPDVLHFVVPSMHQATVGRLFYPEYEVTTPDFARRSIITALNTTKDWTGSSIETSATIPLSVLALVVVACLRRQAGAGVWAWFSGAFAVLAMGPILRVAGRTTFTLFHLPVILPYAVLVSRPGFDVMRTPARFLMIASVGLAILAAWGLLSLMASAPRRAGLVAALATAAVLVECWPRVWAQHAFPPVPEFYTRLAQDPDRYAVLDLPGARWSPHGASAYMYYQMTHGKGIAWAYLSRRHRRYPLEGLEGILDHNPPNGAATRARLAELGYRYVVWHKRASEIFVSRRPDRIAGGRVPVPPTDAQINPFIREAFARDTPIVDDDLVTVYRVQP